MSKKGWIIPMVAALILAPTGAATYYGINYTNLQEEQKTTNTEADSLKQGMVELLAQKEELAEKLASMTEENEANKALVAQAQADYAAVSSQIDSLNAQIAALEESEEENALQIALLEEQKLSVTNELTRLNGIVEDYAEVQAGTKKVAMFFVEDTNVYTCAVATDATSVTPSYDKNTYSVTSWKLADGTSVDPTNYTYTEDVTFYADEFEYKYMVDCHYYLSWAVGQPITNNGGRWSVAFSSLSNGGAAMLKGTLPNKYEIVGVNVNGKNYYGDQRSLDWGKIIEEHGVKPGGDLVVKPLARLISYSADDYAMGLNYTYIYDSYEIMPSGATGISNENELFDGDFRKHDGVYIGGSLMFKNAEGNTFSAIYKILGDKLTTGEFDLEINKEGVFVGTIKCRYNYQKQTIAPIPDPTEDRPALVDANVYEITFLEGAEELELMSHTQTLYKFDFIEVGDIA